MSEEKKITVREQKMKKNHMKAKLIFFAVLAVILLLIAIFAEYLCPYDPYAQNLLEAQQPPSMAHPLGTDRYGRDMLSRVIIGSTTSIYATLLLVAIITVTGTAIGIICGWCGGKADTILMRISDVFLAFPGLVFALAVAGVLGGGVQNAIIALGAISWPKFARLARGLTLAQKDSSYLMAARLSGSSTPKLLVKHILPNIAGPILVTSVLDIGTMMMELAGLSFLGLGVKPPMAEWGSMISDGRVMLQTAPWMVLAPGGAIFVTVMIFNLLGDTLRDYMDPKQRYR
ncbi:MAG: nickel transporter permease [Blautia sp.]|nr:nickel transporter permease [Blautia sp.]